MNRYVVIGAGVVVVAGLAALFGLETAKEIVSFVFGLTGGAGQ